MKNEDVVSIWLNGGTLYRQSINIWTDGKAIGSYGRHFIIALRTGHSTFLFCNDSYSNTTSQHQSLVLNEINNDEIIYCSQKEIQRAYHNPGEPVIIEKEVTSNNPEYAIDIMRKVWYEDENIYSPFPRQQVQDFFKELKDKARKREAKRRMGKITTKSPYTERMKTYALRTKSNKELSALELDTRTEESIQRVLENYYEHEGSTTNIPEETLEEIKTKIFVRNIAR